MKQCQTMAEVRAEVDRLDREITALFVERLGLMEQAGRIKPTRDLVRDSARIEDVVAKVRAEATRLKGDPDFLEKIYRPMIELCIAHEFTIFDDLATD